jgi:hypothetical protein
VWKTAVELGFGCLQQQWVKHYGLEGFVGSFVMAAITWLVDGVGLVVQGGVAIKDTWLHIGGYRIQVRLPAVTDPFRPYVGEWHVHGSSMIIRADRTGTTTWNAGPCDGDSSLMCSGVADLVFTDGDGEGVIATMREVRYVDGSGQVRTDQRIWPDSPVAGSRFSLRPVDEDVLISAVVAGPNYIGNPYWCGERANQKWLTECN